MQNTTPSAQHDEFVHKTTARLLWPTIIGGVFLIAAVHNANKEILQLVAYGLIVVFTAVHCAEQRVSWKYAVIAGGTVGAVAAGLVALYKMIEQFSVVSVFNLFTEPVFTGVLAGLATGMVFIGVQSIFHRSKRKEVAYD